MGETLSLTSIHTKYAVINVSGALSLDLGEDEVSP